MDNITILMAVALVLVAFKDKLTAWAQKMKVKLTVTKAQSLAEHHHARTMGAIERQGSEMMMFRGELNHIKGQLQEILHAHKDERAQSLAAYNVLMTSLNEQAEALANIRRSLEAPVAPAVDIAPLQSTIEGIHVVVENMRASLEKATGEEATAMNTLYMQGLGGLTRSQSTVVEKLTQLHESQVAVLAALNRLTNN